MNFIINDDDRTLMQKIVDKRNYYEATHGLLKNLDNFAKTTDYLLVEDGTIVISHSSKETIKLSDKLEKSKKGLNIFLVSVLEGDNNCFNNCYQSATLLTKGKNKIDPKIFESLKEFNFAETSSLSNYFKWKEETYKENKDKENDYFAFYKLYFNKEVVDIKIIEQ